MRRYENQRKPVPTLWKVGNLQERRDLLNLQDGYPAIPSSTATTFIMRRTGTRTGRFIMYAIFLLVLASGTAEDCHAQRWGKKNRRTDKKEKVSVQEVRKSALSSSTGQQKLMQENEGRLAFFVEGEDTIYYDTIAASKIYSQIPKQKGREWREYYRLVHNFSKSYPYALVARKLVVEADSTIAADKLKGAKREKYVSKVQKEIFDVFEGQMRQLTVSQGALIMKLVDREVGKSSYDIIKGYKSGITAGFWQGIAKIFGSDLKKPYDPEGEDKLTEELVKIWEAGEFPALYWSLFWTDPPEMPIPEKYL